MTSWGLIDWIRHGNITVHIALSVACILGYLYIIFTRRGTGRHVRAGKFVLALVPPLVATNALGAWFILGKPDHFGVDRFYIIEVEVSVGLSMLSFLHWVNALYGVVGFQRHFRSAWRFIAGPASVIALNVIGTAATYVWFYHVRRDLAYDSIHVPYEMLRASMVPLGWLVYLVARRLGDRTARIELHVANFYAFGAILLANVVNGGAGRFVFFFLDFQQRRYLNYSCLLAFTGYLVFRIGRLYLQHEKSAARLPTASA